MQEVIDHAGGASYTEALPGKATLVHLNNGSIVAHSYLARKATVKKELQSSFLSYRIKEFNQFMVATPPNQSSQ